MQTPAETGSLNRQKIITHQSSVPFLAAGLAFFVYGSQRSIESIGSYVVGGVVALGVFWISRIIFPDRKETVELPPNTGDQKIDALIGEARATLSGFHANNEQIKDPSVSACIDDIEKSGNAILARLAEQPPLYGQLRSFFSYYLPTTSKLLDARAAIEMGNAKGDSADEVRTRTDRVLPEIARAFQKQLDALDKHRYLDLQVEMDVMEGMLKSDGFQDTISIPKSALKTKGEPPQ